MHKYIISSIIVLTLLLVTWIVTKYINILPVSVRFSNPKKEALLSLIPFVFAIVIAMLIYSLDLGGKILSLFWMSKIDLTLMILFLFCFEMILIVPFAIMMIIRKQGIKSVGITK
jgi:hypothetical protein